MYEFQHGSSFPDNEPQIPLKVENEREMKVVGMLIKTEVYWDAWPLCVH